MVVPPSGYAVPADAEILKLAAELAPDAEAVRLGGWTSVNFRLKRSASAIASAYPPRVAGPASPAGERGSALPAGVPRPAREAGPAGDAGPAGPISPAWLAAAAAPAAPAAPAGLADDDLVLRVHPRYLSRRRLRAVQRLREALAESGVIVPTALAYGRSTILRCGDSLAEVERFLPNEELAPSWSAYRWLYRAMGTIHRVLAMVDVEVPRPLSAHFAAVGTLRSWMPHTWAAARGSAEATVTAERLDQVTKRIRNRWVPPAHLPTQVVHGDMKLENVLRAPDGATIYLDFGHTARRPRIHDLAFALTHSIITVNGDVPTDPAGFPWEQIPPLIEEYQSAAGWHLTPIERRALAPYTAALRLYFAGVAWHATSDPIDWLSNQATSLALSNHLLDHPDALLPT